MFLQVLVSTLEKKWRALGQTLAERCSRTAILDSGLQRSKSSVKRAGPKAGHLAPRPPAEEDKLLRLTVEDLSIRRNWGKGSK